MARTRLTNPQRLVELKYNPYQVSFLNARRLRVCPGQCVDDAGVRLSWSMLESLVCPQCQQKGVRPYRRFFLRAGRRGGKTRAGALSAIEETIVPYSVGWCCAPSFPELEDYVIPAFFSQLPSEWFDHPLTNWSEDRLTLTLPNMAMVQFRSLDDPNRGAGPGLDWVWIDEGRKIQVLAWQLLRPALTERKGIAWVTSSPDWGEDWCHTNFYQPALDGVAGFWATEYRTVDNPIIDPAEVEAARISMPPELFRREYEASLEYPTGTIYGALIDKCEADDDRIRKWIPEWPMIDISRPSIAAMDPGTDHPFAAVHIVATPSGLVVVNEYEERKGLYLDHARALKDMVKPLTPRWAIDKTQAQAAIEMAAHGIYAAGAEYDVDGGIQRVYSWMALGQLVIAKSKCPRLIKRLRHYRWAESAETKKGVTKPAPFKKDDDLCFVAGTLITTPSGERPIESMTVGDEVLTRKGWRTVVAAAPTGARPISTLVTSDGRTIHGTPNHPIWVAGRGFTRMDALRYGDILSTCPPIAWSRSGTESASTATRTPLVAAIACIGSRISPRVVKACRRFIRNCGRPRTGPSRQGTTSTIVTETPSITRSTTWKPNPKANTSAIITRAAFVAWMNSAIWMRFVRCLLSGIDRPLVVAGIGHTGVSHGPIESLSLSRATNAGARLNHGRAMGSGSVRTPASPRIDGQVRSMWSPGRVSSAVRDFLRRSIPALGPVPGRAVRVCGIYPAGTAQVYNLTVEDVHEYFANGVLASNCDALRYCVMLWPELPKDHPASDDPIRRNLSMLSAQARIEITRNLPKDPNPSDEGLVRVTDDFTPDYMGDMTSSVDSAYAHYYS